MTDTPTTDTREGESTDDDPQDRDPGGVAGRAPGTAGGGEGPRPARRRAGAAAAGAAVGARGKGLSLRHRRRPRLAGRPLRGARAAPRVPLHVRARLPGGLPVLLHDRGRVQRLRGAPGPPRRGAVGGVAGAPRQAPGLQAAARLDLPVGLRAQRRLQLRFQRLVHRGAAA